MMSSWKGLVWSWLKPAPRQGRLCPNWALGVETLEARDTPSISVSGTPPTWQAVGPVSIQNASNVVTGTTPAQNIDVGAINAVAIDPFNANHVIVGAVNGGIWSTSNYGTPGISWSPTGDNLQSLAVSTVAFSPTVQNLVYAGTGSFTAGGLGPYFAGSVSEPGVGGGAVGIYRSTDGGSTWTQLGASVFSGLRIQSLVPTSLNGGQTIFAATNDGGPGKAGIYRSDNGGATWTRVSGASGLPNLGVTSMIADPGNANRFYAFALGTGGGVFMLDVTGGNTTWVNISGNLPSGVLSGASRVVLAASAAGVNPVYAAVIGSTSWGDAPIGIYRAVPFANSGGTSPTYIWTAIGPGGLPPDVNPEGQATTHFAITADPTSDQIVYVGGDTVDGNGPFYGNIARGDAIANTWTTITAQPNPVPPAHPGTVMPSNPGPQPTTAPHADTRWMVFAGNNAILVGTDGGIYQVTNPRAAGSAPVWTSVNSNLQISELYQAAIDNKGTVSTADDVILAGAQDNGTSMAPVGQNWREITGGDGTVVLVDSTNKVQYYSSQSLSLAVVDAQGNKTFPAGTILGTTNSISLIGNTSFMPFVPPVTLNQAQQGLLLVGGNNGTLFLSNNRGSTFTSIGGVSGNTPLQVPNVTSTVTAVAFGTQQIRNAAYVATSDGNISQSYDITSITPSRGNFTLTDFKSVAGGAAAFSIVMDPIDPRVAYAATINGVFRTTDGVHWTNVTGNLASLTSGGGLVNLGGLALFKNGGAQNDTLLVGGYGGVYALKLSQLNGGAVTWLKFGTGIPNAVVTSVVYDSLSDSIVAGTYGRGVFRMTSVTSALNSTPTVTVTGTSGADNIAIYPTPNDPTKFTVSDGLGNTQSFSLATYRSVVIQGLGGADTITVGAPGPGQGGSTAPLGLLINVNGGGDAGDTLYVNDLADGTARQVTVTPTTIGAGAGDTLFGTPGQVSYSGFDSGSIRFQLGGGGNTLQVNDSTIQSPATYTLNSTQLGRSVGASYGFTGVNQLILTGGAGGNVFNIQSTPGATTVNGGAGADTFNVSSNAPANSAVIGSLGGALSLNGGGGADRAQVNGTDGNETVTAQITSTSGNGSLSGLPQPINFSGIGSMGYNGLGGSNTFTFADATGGGHGSPTNPAAGMVFAPSGDTSGTVRLGAFSLSIGSVNSGLYLNGNPSGSGTPDTLMILGTSAPGLQSSYGEAVVGDGRDQITVSDFQVSVTSLMAGALLSAIPVQSNGSPTFSTIYVATGNESLGGDQVTVTPSSQVNLVVDGMGPTNTPGDQVTVTSVGPFNPGFTNDPSLGPPQNRVNDISSGASVGLIGFERTSYQGNGIGSGTLNSGLIAVASDTGPESIVRAYDRLSGELRFQITPFQGWTGGLSVATGDVNGDGVADVIVGAGPGGGPVVGVFSGIDGSMISSFFAYEPAFRGGVNVSAADMTGSGHVDIITGTGPGGGPRLRIFDGMTGAPLRDAFVYDSAFRGGVNITVGDVNGDGTPDLITSTGSGGGPRVIVLDGNTLKQIASFYVFDPNSRTGFYVAAGDVNGDGRADIIVGAGAGAPGEVKVFSGLNAGLITDFFVNDPFVPQSATTPNNPSDAGVRVSAADVNGDGVDDILTAKGPGSLPILRAYQVTGVNPQTNALFPTLQQIRYQSVFDDGFTSGVFIGSSD